jgi:hypothetical protein
MLEEVKKIIDRRGFKVHSSSMFLIQHYVILLLFSYLQCLINSSSPHLFIACIGQPWRRGDKEAEQVQVY